MTSYRELEVWKRSRQLAKDVYMLTQNYPKEELYGLTGQIRRCAVSIASNIAEGTGRRSAADTLHFLYIARGSIHELETQLFISCDVAYIDTAVLENYLEVTGNIGRLLNGLIRRYQAQHLKAHQKKHDSNAPDSNS